LPSPVRTREERVSYTRAPSRGGIGLAEWTAGHRESASQVMELWQPARTGQRAAASRAAPTRCRRSVSVSVVGVDFERLLMEASPDGHVGAREKSSSALGLSAWPARCSGRVAARGRGQPSGASRATSTSPWSRSQSAAIAAGGRLLLPTAHSWMRTLPSRSTPRASPVLVGGSDDRRPGLGGRVARAIELESAGKRVLRSSCVDSLGRRCSRKVRFAPATSGVTPLPLPQRQQTSPFSLRRAHCLNGIQSRCFRRLQASAE